MDFNMEALLLSGVHGDYKFSAIRLQLKHGEVEIGPPQKEGEGEGDAANVVLQVYNEFAQEVEIEYQPAIKQQDTQWKFACDGRVLKTVVPYKFWKTYLYPHEHEHKEFCQWPFETEQEDATPASAPAAESSNPSALPVAFTRERETTIPEPNEYVIAQRNEGVGLFLLAPPNCPSEAYPRNLHAWRQQGQGPPSRPVLQTTQSNKLSQAQSHRRTVEFANSTVFGDKYLAEAAKKIKLKSPRAISPTSKNREISEKEIRVQCSRPAVSWNPAKDVGHSGTESFERVIKVKCYRPNSDLSTEQSKEEVRSGNTPSSATEEFFMAKFGLQYERSPSLDGKRDTGLQPLRQNYARETMDGAVLPLPCPETVGVSELMHSRVSGYPTSARATIHAATSLMPSPRMKGDFLACPRDNADFQTRAREKGSLYGYGQQYNILTIGKIMLKEEHEVEATNIWRRRCEWISTETSNLFKQGKSSGDFFKGVFDFLAKEREMFLNRGKKYLAAKKNALSIPRTVYPPSVLCTCFKPAVRDIDDMAFATSRTAGIQSVLVRIWTCRSSVEATQA